MILGSRKFNKSKKGNMVIDGLMILIILFVFAIIGLFCLKIFDEANDSIQSDIGMSNESKTIASNVNGSLPKTLDNIFLTMMVLLTAFVIISVFMLDSHPIFFILMIILLIGVFIVAMILANTYDDVASGAGMTTYANEMLYTGWIMSHLLEVAIAITFLGGVALYAKLKI